ncbi:hypothetical protein WISP_141612 [Willisornis vidua]|uniref:Uncharacterized protein n=1 Tax=Willisornis vidua TaxID=1566151 RepID=A0ABQ9CLX8_9PASS|nr:hypothetical protein WISP_141612 [Willisornis vidua]
MVDKNSQFVKPYIIYKKLNIKKDQIKRYALSRYMCALVASGIISEQDPNLENSVLGSSVEERHGAPGTDQKRVTKMIRGLKRLSYKDRDETVRDFIHSELANPASYNSTTSGFGLSKGDTVDGDEVNGLSGLGT